MTHRLKISGFSLIIMKLDSLFKLVTEAIGKHLSHLGIRKVDGMALFPLETTDNEITYKLVVETGEGGGKAVSDKTGHDISLEIVKDSTNNATRCPRGMQSAEGCEFYDGGTCRGVVYLTYPPQYDPCVFCSGTKGCQNNGNACKSVLWRMPDAQLLSNDR